MQDVARHQDVPTRVAPLAEERDGFGARQRVQAVERLVEHDDGGVVRDGLRELHTLPHAFAIRRDRAVHGVGERHQLEGG